MLTSFLHQFQFSRVHAYFTELNISREISILGLIFILHRLGAERSQEFVLGGLTADAPKAPRSRRRRHRGRKVWEGVSD